MLGANATCLEVLGVVCAAANRWRSRSFCEDCDWRNEFITNDGAGVVAGMVKIEKRGQAGAGWVQTWALVCSGGSTEGSVWLRMSLRTESIDDVICGGTR